MTRMLANRWRPIAAVLFGLALVMLSLTAWELARAVGIYRSRVDANTLRIDNLREQVRGLGGDPDGPPTVIVNVPPARPATSAPPQPASPTTREPRDPAPPRPRQPTTRPSPTRTTASPSPSPCAVRVPLTGRCLA